MIAERTNACMIRTAKQHKSGQTDDQIECLCRPSVARTSAHACNPPRAKPEIRGGPSAEGAAAGTGDGTEPCKFIKFASDPAVELWMFTGERTDSISSGFLAAAMQSYSTFLVCRLASLEIKP